MDTKNNKAVEKKTGLNIIDVVIILFLIACIIGIIFRVGNFGVFNDKDLRNYRVYFEVTDVAYTSKDAFKAGDTVTLVDLNMPLGRIENIDEITPKTEYVKTSDGAFLEYEYPKDTRINVYGTVISAGLLTDEGYLLDGKTYVTPGAKYFVRTEHIDCTITIVKIAQK